MLSEYQQSPSRYTTNTLNCARACCGSSQRGEVACTQKRCPAVSCSHPAVDGCACGVCDGCHFEGRNCFNGERFPHPTDGCQLCSCLVGSKHSGVLSLRIQLHFHHFNPAKYICYFCSTVQLYLPLKYIHLHSNP